MPLAADYVSSRNVRTKGQVLLKLAALVYESIVNPAAKVTNGISASHAGAGAAGTTFMTLGGSLASGGVARLLPARNVVITVTHASSVVAMSGTITGTKGRQTITEAWSVTATGTTKTFTGKKAFDTVTSITETIAADASANTIIAGSGDVLGTAGAVSCSSLVKETSAGSVVTNGTLVKASTASTDDPRGTYAPNTIPNGSTAYELWYLSNNPELTAG